MELHDMKMDQDRDEAVVIAVREMAEDAMEREKYPWGLRLTLNRKVLENLGLKLSGFEPGQSVKLQAKAEVEEVRMVKSRENRSEDGNCLELQITSLAVDKPEDFSEAWNEANT